MKLVILKVAKLVRLMDLLKVALKGKIMVDKLVVLTASELVGVLVVMLVDLWVLMKAN